MNAGSSPLTGKKGVKAFVVGTTRTPVVEVDTEATAAYVRFSRAKVARTVPFGGKHTLAMIDLDQKVTLSESSSWGRKTSVSASCYAARLSSA